MRYTGPVQYPLEVPSSGSPGEVHLLVPYACCRIWECTPYNKVRRCGYCGERPKALTL